ncbi:MAG: hypothetical protein ACXV8Q_06645 [Methylobacter sp.]
MEDVLVLGVSHSPVFNHPLFKEKFPNLFFNVITVIGATASGKPLSNLLQAGHCYAGRGRYRLCHLVSGAKIPGIRCRDDGQSHRKSFPFFD